MSSPARIPGNRLAWVQLVASIVSGAAARWVSPKIGTSDRHKDFVDFFATSASVIAALLVALAIEARYVVRSVFLATLSACSVAAGLVGAIAALSPDLSVREYRWLFALTVGGGMGALIAALVIGAQTLTADLEQMRQAELQRFLERAQEVMKARGAGSG